MFLKYCKKGLHTEVLYWRGNRDLLLPMKSHDGNTGGGCLILPCHGVQPLEGLSLTTSHACGMAFHPSLKERRS